MDFAKPPDPTLTHFESRYADLEKEWADLQGIANHTSIQDGDYCKSLGPLINKYTVKMGETQPWRRKRLDKDVLEAYGWAYHIELNFLASLAIACRMARDKVPLLGENSGQFAKVVYMGSSGQILEKNKDKEFFKETLSNQAHLLHHMAHFEVEGRRVYEVSAGLAEQLRYTEIRGLKTNVLHVPYPSVYLIVPRAADLQVFNRDSGWHQVTGVYLHEGQEPERAWEFLAIGEDKPYKLENLLWFNNDAFVYFRLPLLPDQTVEGAVEKEQANDATNIVWANMKTQWADIFRWVMNVMLYCTLPEADVEQVIANREARQLWERMKKCKGKKRSELQRQLNGMFMRKRVYLGRKITVMRTVSEESDETTKTGHTLTVRTRVSGHMRMVPHGPHSSLRRLQWIPPFWRGPEEGTLGSTVHALK